MFFNKYTNYYHLHDWCCTCPEYTGYASPDRDGRRGRGGGGYGSSGGLGPAESDEGEKGENGGGYGHASEGIERDIVYYFICFICFDEYWQCPGYTGYASEDGGWRREGGGGGHGCPGGLGAAVEDEGEKEKDGGGYGYGSEEIEQDMFYYFICLFLIIKYTHYYYLYDWYCLCKYWWFGNSIERWRRESRRWWCARWCFRGHWYIATIYVLMYRMCLQYV